MFRADLHCHTRFSDGSFTPEEIILKAKENNLSALVITDHDTIDAYPEAIEIAKREGILLGTGIELSCFFEEQSVHILGYDFQLDSEPLIDLCKKHYDRRMKRNRGILERLKKKGFVIEEKELLEAFPSSSRIGRPHIAELLIRKGHVRDMQHAFQLYLGDQCSCYVSSSGITPEETVEIIHQAGGKAFIAHPHLIRKQRIVEHLLTLPFDGIECYYSVLPSHREKKWLQIAKQRKMLISGGSDFHGSFKPYIELGSSWVDEEHFRKIFSNLV